MNNGPAHGRQRGVALVVALIMLLAVTLIAVSASNLVQSNLKIVQNMESRDMVRAAAHAALEEAISSGRFMESPDAMFAVSCEENNQRCYDFNGDGTDDVTVAVAEPTCVVVQPIKNSELDVFNS
ncbi:MAG: pilus assembly PilX family protein, partial [Halioglobus sp.]